MTLEEFFSLPDDGLMHELNKGRLETKPLPYVRHGRVAKRIFNCMQGFLDEHPIGELMIGRTAHLLSAPGAPPIVRGPDLSYLPQDRVSQLDPDQPIPGAPELAIEVAAEEDTFVELLRRTAQYLAAGGRLVWVVYPEQREVRVFEASGAIRILKESDTLEAPDLLPGFSTPIARFFE